MITIELHKKKKGLVLLVGTFLLIVLSAVVFWSLNHRTNAAPVVGFNSSNIIDDMVFTNSNTMSPDDIQVFLNGKVPVCDTWGTQPSEFGGGTRRQWAEARGYSPPYTCIKDYYEGGKSAAQIIHTAAKDFNINPQVLIVLLQKEQALITDTWPLSSQYRTATGYGCPDSTPGVCNESYYGFTNQVNWAARMFRAIMNASPTWYTPYVVGQNYIRWNPAASCGGSYITIENRATQALYNYTPYAPNQAALNAGYGTGDSCSAYGNRNFYLYFTDWFGSVRSNDTYNPHPNGTLVSFDGAVYLIEEGKLRHITNGTYFEVNGYRWQDVKPATTGDRNLAKAANIDYIRPGIFYRTAGSGIYRTVIEGSDWAKQVISYNSFVTLGDNWSKVPVVPESTIPSKNASDIFTQDRHPDGSLISDGINVYYLDYNARRYVRPAVFDSYRWSWDSVQRATTADKALPAGPDMELRGGSVVSNNGNLYIVNNTPSATTIRPIGPWECYANIFKYNMGDVIYLKNNEVPAVSSRISC